MRQFWMLVTLICFIFTGFIAACEKLKEVGTAKGSRGEALFKQHCSRCHPDGGNNVHPQKTLHKKDREANGVKSASDIIGKMRNPGPGMALFDEKTIPNKDAKKIAEYILKTF
jgi:cytochrome c6